MTARCGVAEMLTQPRNHGVHHARVHGGGRAIVEIDGEMRGHVHDWLLSRFRLAKNGKAMNSGESIQADNTAPHSHARRCPALRVSKVDQRSEERRVGKECRSRWSPYH